jgi:hypothetical protein
MTLKLRLSTRFSPFISAFIFWVVKKYLTDEQVLHYIDALVRRDPDKWSLMISGPIFDSEQDGIVRQICFKLRSPGLLIFAGNLRDTSSAAKDFFALLVTRFITKNSLFASEDYQQKYPVLKRAYESWRKRHEEAISYEQMLGRSIFLLAREEGLKSALKVALKGVTSLEELPLSLEEAPDHSPAALWILRQFCPPELRLAVDEQHELVLPLSWKHQVPTVIFDDAAVRGRCWRYFGSEGDTIWIGPPAVGNPGTVRRQLAFRAKVEINGQSVSFGAKNLAEFLGKLTEITSRLHFKTYPFPQPYAMLANLALPSIPEELRTCIYGTDPVSNVNLVAFSAWFFDPRTAHFKLSWFPEAEVAIRRQAESERMLSA